jgi:hypothetical protein
MAAVDDDACTVVLMPLDRKPAPGQVPNCGCSPAMASRIRSGSVAMRRCRRWSCPRRCVKACCARAAIERLAGGVDGAARRLAHGAPHGLHCRPGPLTRL